MATYGCYVVEFEKQQIGKRKWDKAPSRRLFVIERFFVAVTLWLVDVEKVL